MSQAGIALQREQLTYCGYLRSPALCAAGYALVGHDPVRMAELLDLHQARLAAKRNKHEGHKGHEGSTKSEESS